MLTLRDKIFYGLLILIIIIAFVLSIIAFTKCDKYDNFGDKCNYAVPVPGGGEGKYPADWCIYDEKDDKCVFVIKDVNPRCNNNPTGNSDIILCDKNGFPDSTANRINNEYLCVANQNLCKN